MTNLGFKELLTLHLHYLNFKVPHFLVYPREDLPLWAESLRHGSWFVITDAVDKGELRWDVHAPNATNFHATDGLVDALDNFFRVPHLVDERFVAVVGAGVDKVAVGSPQHPLELHRLALGHRLRARPHQVVEVFHLQKRKKKGGGG